MPGRITLIGRMSVRTEVSDGVAEVTLDRPEKLNAFDDAMAAAFGAALDEAESSGARALVLRGEGKGFCAGRDLGDAKPGEEDGGLVLADVYNPLFSRLAAFPAPTFAAVHGAALGVGLGLALACDVVYAATDAKIGSPFARIGAVFDSGGHHYFVRRLGSHRALELIYTGRLLSGDEASQWGLVNSAIPAADLLATVRDMARKVAAGPSAAFGLSKEIVGRIETEGLGLAAVLDLEAAAQSAASRSADYVEGISAFQEKRTPNFTGK
jgi:enoyl-CoA hydratase/carnithine racemase